MRNLSKNQITALTWLKDQPVSGLIASGAGTMDIKWHMDHAPCSAASLRSLAKRGFAREIDNYFEITPDGIAARANAIIHNK